MKSKDHGFGRCENHPRRWAIVKLQSHAVCMPCFETNMALIGSAIHGAIKGLGATPGAISISVHKDA